MITLLYENSFTIIIIKVPLKTLDNKGALIFSKVPTKVMFLYQLHWCQRFIMADNIHDKILTSVTNAEQTVEMVPLCVNIAPLGKPNKNSSYVS